MMPTAKASSAAATGSSIIFLEDGRLQAARVLGRGSSNYRVSLEDGGQRRLPLAKALAEIEDGSLPRLLAEAGRRLEEISVSQLHQRCAGKALAAGPLARLAFGDDDPAGLIALKAALVVDPGFFVAEGQLHQPVPPAQAQAVIDGRRRRQLSAQQQQRFMDGIKQGKIDEQVAAAAIAFIERRHDPASDAFRVLRRYSCIARVPIHALAVRWGLIADEHELHLRIALAEVPGAFAAGTQDDAAATPELDIDALPLIAEEAFSIDGAGTIEVDDAFSLHRNRSGGWQVGVHIAAPALQLPPAALDQAAARMTSVYLPDRKIMQFPEPVLRSYALTAGGLRPALSLLQDFDPESGRLGPPRLAIGKIRMAANISLDQFVGWQPGDAGDFSEQLALLAQMTSLLPSARNQRAMERSFIIRADADSGAQIVHRRQLEKIDSLIAALMVHYDRVGTELLRAAGAARLLRSCGRNLVRAGGDQQDKEYAWLSSPLRRYIDLLNQQQLIAVIAGRPPPHDAAFMRAQASEYDKRAEVARRAQQRLERYWAFRWLQERRGESFPAIVSGCRRSVDLEELPVAVKIAAPGGMVAHSKVRVRIDSVDLGELVAQGQLCR